MKKIDIGIILLITSVIGMAAAVLSQNIEFFYFFLLVFLGLSVAVLFGFTATGRLSRPESFDAAIIGPLPELNGWDKPFAKVQDDRMKWISRIISPFKRRKQGEFRELRSEVIWDKHQNDE